MSRTHHGFFANIGITTCLVILLSISLVVSLATSPDAAARFNLEDPHYFVKRQLIFAVLAFITFAILSRIPPIYLRRLAFLATLVGLTTLFAVLFAGKTVNGSQRWLNLGPIAVQPSELFKPFMLVSFAWCLSKFQENKEKGWMISGGTLIALYLGLFLMQPDVGQTFLLAFSASIVVYSFGLRLRYLLGFAGVSIAFLSALYGLMPHVKRRLDTFFGIGGEASYQVKMALNAISEGGLMGSGPGAGYWKSKLPDAHTDFVFSVLAEEFGLIGVALLLILYGYVVMRLFLNASALLNPFRRACALSLTFLLAIQAMINIGVNLALLPAKGMTLPFVSYGGSSMLGCAVTLGFACAFSKAQR